MPEPVKLSSPETGQFWEIPVLWEDDHLLALNKPAGLPVSPDRSDPARPSLMNLLHRGIERGAPLFSLSSCQALTVPDAAWSIPSDCKTVTTM